MHFHDPVAQRVEHQIADDGMRRIDRVAGTREVAVEPPVAVQPVIDCVVDAAETDRRSQFATFAGVVEYHVEDDLQTRAMERPNHLLEFQTVRTALANACVGRLGGEEADRIVSPKVPQRLRRSGIDPQQTMFVELLHGHQLDRGDTKVLQIGDLLDQPAIGPGKLDARAGTDGIAADIQLVDDRRSPGVTEGLIALPIEVRLRDHAFRCGGRIVDFGERQIQ